MKKRCSTCKLEKDLTEFYKLRKSKDGFSYRCISCDKFFTKRDTERYKERRRKTLKRWQLRNWYNISEEEYESLKDKQNNVCALCEKVCSSKRGLAIDHCHIKNVIRGLLCNRCNRGIGLLGDSPKLLRKAANYLEIH